MRKLVFALTLILTVSGFAQKSKLAPELAQRHDQSMTEVIIRYKVMPSSLHRRRIASRNGAVHTDLSFIRSLHATMPASRLAELAEDKDVEYIAPNRTIGSSLYNTAGAVNAQAAWNLGLDGTGVGVAVVDSGIHVGTDLNPLPGSTRSGSTVIANFDTIGGGTDDHYGHGTHVSGIIAGNGKASDCNQCDLQLRGIAPGVRIVNFHALDQNGQGTDASVISAINQAIQLKNTYNIKVLNLSLGRPVFESYTLDPLCQAVEAAWNAGIVVVVAAGNDGRDNGVGTNGYGTITAPGNDPYVITVGAMNAMGTPIVATTS